MASSVESGAAPCTRPRDPAAGGESAPECPPYAGLHRDRAGRVGDLAGADRADRSSGGADSRTARARAAGRELLAGGCVAVNRPVPQITREELQRALEHPVSGHQRESEHCDRIAEILWRRFYDDQIPTFRVLSSELGVSMERARQLCVEGVLRLRRNWRLRRHLDVLARVPSGSRLHDAITRKWS